MKAIVIIIYKTDFVKGSDVSTVKYSNRDELIGRIGCLVDVVMQVIIKQPNAYIEDIKIIE